MQTNFFKFTLPISHITYWNSKIPFPFQPLHQSANKCKCLNTMQAISQRFVKEQAMLFTAWYTALRWYPRRKPIRLLTLMHWWAPWKTLGVTGFNSYVNERVPKTKHLQPNRVRNSHPVAPLPRLKKWWQLMIKRLISNRGWLGWCANKK